MLWQVAPSVIYPTLFHFRRLPARAAEKKTANTKELSKPQYIIHKKRDTLGLSYLFGGLPFQLKFFLVAESIPV